MRARILVCCTLLALLVEACAFGSASDSGGIPERTRSWLVVYSDSNYTIALDSARLTAPAWAHEFPVWFRTVHNHKRLRRGQRWTRETVKSVIWCDKRLYKIESVELDDGRRTVSRQRADHAELLQQRWRVPETGTADEASLDAACRLVRRRARS